jgi:hypothetical protein
MGASGRDFGLVKCDSERGGWIRRASANRSNGRRRDRGASYGFEQRRNEADVSCPTSTVFILT